MITCDTPSLSPLAVIIAWWQRFGVMCPGLSLEKAVVIRDQYSWIIGSYFMSIKDNMKSRDCVILGHCDAVYEDLTLSCYGSGI